LVSKEDMLLIIKKRYILNMYRFTNNAVQSVYNSTSIAESAISSIDL